MKNDKLMSFLVFLGCLFVVVLFYGAIYLWWNYIVMDFGMTIDFPNDRSVIGDVDTDPVRPIKIPVECDIFDSVDDVETTSVEPAYGRFNVPLEDELQNYIFEQCIEKNVPPELIFAMIYVESSYRPSAMGDGGQSYGLMQIQPRWHQERIDKLGCTDLQDPYQNVKVGIDYMADLIGRKGSVEWALMAYNSGPSIANKKTKAGEITSYVTKVFAKRDKLLEGYE